LVTGSCWLLASGFWLLAAGSDKLWYFLPQKHKISQSISNQIAFYLHSEKLPTHSAKLPTHSASMQTHFSCSTYQSATLFFQFAALFFQSSALFFSLSSLFYQYSSIIIQYSLVNLADYENYKQIASFFLAIIILQGKKFAMTTPIEP